MREGGAYTLSQGMQTFEMRGDDKRNGGARELSKVHCVNRQKGYHRQQV